jgi:hypothetical protein
VDGDAKLYDPGSGSLGVREVSRLIARLCYRQFGVATASSASW